MAKSLHKSLEAKLAALDGPEWDSSDEEENIPLISDAKRSSKKSSGGKKVSATAKSKDAKHNPSKRTSRSKASSVIYIGHLPPGFEEGEIRGFLLQFGEVKKLRLSRSKKSGAPRGYCFVQFNDPEVAAIVADTMSGYFLMEKRLVCHVLPRDKCHPKLFAGHDKRFVKVDWQGLHREQVNKPRTAEGMKKITARLVKREAGKRKKLKELGIDYDFPGYQDGAEAAKEVKSTTANGNKQNKRKRTSSKELTEKELDTGSVIKNKRRTRSETSSVAKSVSGEVEGKKSSTKKGAKKPREASVDEQEVKKSSTKKKKGRGARSQ